MNRRASSPQPAIPYTALVGQVLLGHRGRKGLQQNDIATALGVSQSAYSRIEQGDTTISISQLRVIARRLDIAPGDLLREADGLAGRLRIQGVVVSDEKGMQPAAVMIGLGILAAILASSK
jgi:transcriptional regulator with XRE-family HTH domain